MDGQLDIFDLLDAQPPAPTFTIYSGLTDRCSWCGEKRYLTGGGVHHTDTRQAWGYAFCHPCKQQYGWPQHGTPITYMEGG